MEELITRNSIYFSGNSHLEVVAEPVPRPESNQLLVQGLVSAISAGTEMLVYRGQVPSGMAIDATIGDLPGEFIYPLKYGYSMIGRVKDIGTAVNPSWMDRTVFAFHPHESHFLTTSDAVIPVPGELTPFDAVFAPNMETAVTFLMDGRPLLGERVVVFGQGIVGLLTTALLSRMPLASLVTLDPLPSRRKASERLGVHSSLDPQDPHILDHIEANLGGPADLVFELSGAPEALNQAITLTGYSGRIVVGSWYGTKKTEVDLGGQFHRNRIRLISSQVSTIAPDLTGRWDKVRRMNWALEMIGVINPAQLISHQVPISAAAEAYQLLDEQPDSTIQVVLTYP